MAFLVPSAITQLSIRNPPSAFLGVSHISYTEYDTKICCLFSRAKNTRRAVASGLEKKRTYRHFVRYFVRASQPLPLPRTCRRPRHHTQSAVNCPAPGEPLRGRVSSERIGFVYVAPLIGGRLTTPVVWVRINNFALVILRWKRMDRDGKGQNCVAVDIFRNDLFVMPAWLIAAVGPERVGCLS